ncbi:MAG: hypothetical protein O3B95_08995, partial [Chloroflexi bacterium]|nr:hypothetical protein [Chloroflexota bacterium]
QGTAQANLISLLPKRSHFAEVQQANFSKCDVVSTAKLARVKIESAVRKKSSRSWRPVGME